MKAGVSEITFKFCDLEKDELLEEFPAAKSEQARCSVCT